jgi:5'-nucleotidase
MIILVDMDGVLADWDSEFDAQLNAIDGAEHIPRIKDQTTFDLFVGKSPEDQAVIRKVMDTPRFYANLKPIPGALEAVKSMVEKGHTVYIVSSPTPSNPTCASDKLDWVVKYLGNEWARRLIITMDKTAVIGDVLIDDKPEIKGEIDPEWTHIVFDRGWNNESEAPFRLMSWNDWETTVDDARRFALVKEYYRMNVKGLN